MGISKRTLMGFCVLSVMVTELLLAMSVSGSEIKDTSCTHAVEYLVPCKDYLLGSGTDQPPIWCCKNILSLYEDAPTTKLRKDLCNCLKYAAISMGVKAKRAQQLAPACKMRLPFPPADPTIDCNTVPLAVLMMETLN